MYIISMLCVNCIYAGYTTIDEYRLIFGDGGGFEATTTENNSKLIPMIQALPYNEPGQTYRAKNINFVRPIIEGETDTALLYEVTSLKYGDKDSPCIPVDTVDTWLGCPRYLVGYLWDEGEGGKIPDINDTISIKEETDALIDKDSSFWKDDLGLIGFEHFDSDPKSSLYKAKTDADLDEAYLLIGDSAKEFIGIVSGNRAESFEINKYKITEMPGNKAIISREPVHMGLGNNPIYIGNDKETNLPIMTLFPEFTDENSTSAKISVNTDRVMRDLTVIGKFKVEGSLASETDFGILHQEANEIHEIVIPTLLADPPGYEVIPGCKPFTVSYVAHNFLIMGHVSGARPAEKSGRVGKVTIWLALKYYNDYGEAVYYKESDIRKQTERVMEGSYAQTSVSLATQLVINLEADNSKIEGNSASSSIESSWLACLRLSNEHTDDDVYYRSEGEQNQIVILGLPGGELSPDVPNPIPPPEFEAFEDSNLEFVTADRPLFQKNAMIFRPEDSEGSTETILAGISASGDFVIFTDGVSPIPLKAPYIDVDVLYKISVLKIIDEKTESLFNIQRFKDSNDDDDFNATDDKLERLSFIIPYKDSSDPNNINDYMRGPYGQYYDADEQKVEIDQSTSIVDYGIATYGTTVNISITGNTSLRLASGVDVGTNSEIRFLNIPSGNFVDMTTPKSYAQLIMDDKQSSGYFLSNPTAEVAFTGVYEGDIGKMFYLKCAAVQNSPLSHPNVFVKPSEGTHDYTQGDCLANNDASNASQPNQKTMELHIHGNEIYTEGLPDLGYKFVILSSLSTNTHRANEGTYLSINLVNPSHTAILNGKQCGSGGGACNTDKSLFSGDTAIWWGANKTYTFTNMAMLENVKGIADDACNGGDCTDDTTYRLNISVLTSHEDIKTNFDKATGDWLNEDGVSFIHEDLYHSGAIWVLGFPDPI